MPEKLKNYFTEQDEEYFRSQDTADVFFQKNSEKNNGTDKKASSSGASCDGVSLCLCLAWLAVFVSSSHCINLYGYDFVNIVSTKICSLDHSTYCDNTIRVLKTPEKRSLIYAEVQAEMKLKFCMYEARHTVSALKKSNVYDDVVSPT